MKPWFLLLIVAPIALGDEAAVSKYRNYSPRQIAALPDAERQSSVPMMYLFAAQRGLAEGSELYFGMQLNALMYSGVHDYEAAVRAFQKDLGDQVNGVLTVWQIDQLEYRAGLQKLSSVGMPEGLVEYRTDAVASIDGTFVILGEQIAYPVNYVKVRCDRAESQCRVDQVYLALPTKKSWVQTYHVQQFDPEYYTITNWSADAVDAVPAGTPGKCRTTTLNLNFRTKEFYEIARNTGGDCEVMGTKLPKLEKPRISQIVDGKDVYEREFQQLQESAFKALASDFQRKAATYVRPAHGKQ